MHAYGRTQRAAEVAVRARRMRLCSQDDGDEE